MKTFFSKTVLACSVAAASLFTVSVAQADPIFNEFTVSHTEGTGPTAVTKTFQAVKIGGNYVEVITFGAATFDVSLFWDAGQFSANGGETALKPGVSGLLTDYGLYAFYKASGTYSASGGKTTFNFTPGTGSLNLYLDENTDTTKIANATSGTGSFNLSNTGDDILIATGNPLAGQGNLDPSLSTCSAGGGSGINCGSFGSTTSFVLTNPAGEAFFTVPSPFYDLSFQSGQLNNFQISGTQTINGNLDVVFGRVPEPSTTALLGLGLLAVGFTARRRKQS